MCRHVAFSRWHVAQVLRTKRRRQKSLGAWEALMPEPRMVR